MKSDLLPCPFCGFGPSGVTQRDEAFYYCRCDACGVFTGDAYDEGTAAEIWNRRTNRATQPAEVAAPPSGLVAAEEWHKILVEEGGSKHSDLIWIFERIQQNALASARGGANGAAAVPEGYAVIPKVKDGLNFTPSHTLVSVIQKKLSKVTLTQTSNPSAKSVTMNGGRCWGRRLKFYGTT